MKLPLRSAWAWYVRSESFAAAAQQGRFAAIIPTTKSRAYVLCQQSLIENEDPFRSELAMILLIIGRDKLYIQPLPLLGSPSGT
jgi:hypothetical protein